MNLSRILRSHTKLVKPQLTRFFKLNDGMHYAMLFAMIPRVAEKKENIRFSHVFCLENIKYS
jgi:hypothetical protein